MELKIDVSIDPEDQSRCWVRKAVYRGKEMLTQAFLSTDGDWIWTPNMSEPPICCYLQVA